MELTPSYTSKNQRISAQRNLDTRRQQQALQLHPKLRLSRVRSIESLLSSGVRHKRLQTREVETFVSALEAEVCALEEKTAQLSKCVHKNGETIRRALSFLRNYGRIASLNYSTIPEEERGLLIQLLALEYRWCFAAAGTTVEVFKREIGRTGAR